MGPCIGVASVLPLGGGDTAGGATRFRRWTESWRGTGCTSLRGVRPEAVRRCAEIDLPGASRVEHERPAVVVGKTREQGVPVPTAIRAAIDPETARQIDGFRGVRIHHKERGLAVVPGD